MLYNNERMYDFCKGEDIALLKILVADDDRIICKGLKAIIEKNTSDCKVVGEAVNGEEALSAIRDLKPDLLITDIKMPVMDGIELIKSIRRLDLKIKIIVLSGFDEYRYVRETLKTGVLDYLLKPIENRELLDLLKRVKNELESEEKSKREHEELNEIVIESVAILQERLLSDLIDGNYNGLGSYERKLNNTGFLTPASYLFCVIAVDNPYKLKKQEEKDICSSILDELDSSIDSTGQQDKMARKVYRLLRGDLICTLFLAHEGYAEELYKSSRLTIENLMKKLYDSTNYSVTTGLSKVYSNIQATHKAYREALTAMESRFYKGGDRMIGYTAESCGYNQLQKDFMDTALSGLTNNIELGQIVKTKRALEEILNDLLQAGISPEEYKNALVDLTRRIFVICPEFKYIAEGYPEKFDLLYMIDVIDTRQELAGYIVSTFCSILEAMNTERSEKSKKIIEIVKEYIRSNYKKDISLKSAADHVYLNPSYLSELFKKEAGINFMDFLTETKIKEAKKLLARPEIKIYEIGQMVGYENTTTFNRAFKKITSVSPARYRELLK